MPRPSLLQQLFCAIGLHGPGWHGPEHGRIDVPFHRQCPHCQMVWRGTQIETRNYRTIGGWQPVERLPLGNPRSPR